VSETLSNFLVDLASDPHRMHAFLDDPAHVLDRSSLSADEKAAILARDGAEIRRALGLRPGQAAMEVMKKDTGKPKPGPKPGPKPTPPKPKA
jgi:hypothetical protein